MPICDSSCNVPLPLPYSNACGVVTKPGGINRIAFLQCDVEFDITSQSAWDTAIAAGEAVVSGLLLGSKPKGTFTKKRVNSCSPERVIGGEKTVVFQDYNEDTVHDADDCGEYEFWNTIQRNPAAYRVILITCDNYMYGPIDDFTIEVDEIIDETDTGNRYFDGTIMWNQIDMYCPTPPPFSSIVFDQDSDVI